MTQNYKKYTWYFTECKDSTVCSVDINVCILCSDHLRSLVPDSSSDLSNK